MSNVRSDWQLDVQLVMTPIVPAAPVFARNPSEAAFVALMQHSV
jgi:hypothetical protein